MLGRFTSIQSRFFVIFLPPIVLITSAVVMLHGYFTFETLQDEFSRKQEEIVFNNSIALVDPMAKNDLKRVERVLEIITTDPDVLYAEVKDLKDKIVAKVGQPARAKEDFAFRTSGVITDVIAADSDWEVLGTLDIVFSKRRVIGASRELIFQNTLLVLVLLTAVILGMFLLLKFFVQNPLARITARAASVAEAAPGQRRAGKTDFAVAGAMCEGLLERIDALETDVKTREEQLRSALETSPAGVVIATRDGRGLYCNSEYARQYGGSMDEVLSINPHLNYADPSDRDRLYQRLSEEGAVKDMDIRMRRKDGTLWWARCTWLPVEFEGVRGHIGWLAAIDGLAAEAGGMQGKRSVQ